MNRLTVVALIVAAIAAATACAHKQEASTSSQSGAEATAASQTAAPSSPAKHYVKFEFNDVAVTTSGNPVLRLGFQAKNAGPDPILCTEEAFTLQLSDGSVLNPDSGAENLCDPDTIDAGGSVKGTMFFDIPSGYSGPVTIIITQDGGEVGRGTAQVH